MLSQELLKQIKTLELKAGRAATEALAGDYISVFRGRGIIFEEVREYIPGDDVRTIDWNVTARLQQPFVKVYREERQMTLMLMVDVSPSQIFGTGQRLKIEAAAELAAVLAFLAQRSQDLVGLIVFSDHIEQYIPPKKGRGHIWQIIRAILTHEGKGQNTDIGKALEFLQQVSTRKVQAFLLSDFWGRDYQKPLGIVAKRHDLVCVHVKDPREDELPNIGIVEIEAGEGENARFWLDTGSKEARQVFKEFCRNRNEQLKKNFERIKAQYLILNPQESVVKPLASFLRKQDRRRRR